MSFITVVAMSRLAATTAAITTAAPPPHLVMILQDDLGFYDVAFNGNTGNQDVTANVTALATSGIVLDAHYVFYWCSPTRRAFLTGRLPLHQGEMLSEDATDDIDLRWDIITQRLQPAGYKSYWYGKGHTGYKSMAHLPTSRGFENFTGFLIGSQSYRSGDRWRNEESFGSMMYSTDLYGEATLATVEKHDASTPLFLYLPWQAVHSPYDQVPGWPYKKGDDANTYRGMLWRSDHYVGALTAMLKSKGMWDNTLIVYSADNGGRGAGVNYPFRGEKRTNFEGGIRAAAFVSGGLVPAKLRGTHSSVRLHIVDWFPTFCQLAGVDPGNVPPEPPLPIDPSNPTKDIYGNNSWPSLDGIDVWPLLMRGERNITAAHPILVISREVIFMDQYKLLVAQRGNTHQGHDLFEQNWQHKNGTWFVSPHYSSKCGTIAPWPANDKTALPCLFDIFADSNETHDLSEDPAHASIFQHMWTTLNHSWLTYYHARSPSAMMGVCDAKCSTAKWRKVNPKNGGGPVCGVPGCDAPTPTPTPPTPSSACTFTQSEVTFDRFFTFIVFLFSLKELHNLIMCRDLAVRKWGRRCR